MPRRDLFVQDLVGGADPNTCPADPRRHRTRLAFAVHPQPADPPEQRLDGFVPKMTIIDLPSFKADPARHGTRTAPSSRSI
jgi:phosphoenolpyruvate carboxykinase (ATP)